jgi:hypothetical protein
VPLTAGIVKYTKIERVRQAYYLDTVYRVASAIRKGRHIFTSVKA